MSEPLVVRVVPDVKGTDKRFDYLVPDELRDQVRVGTVVRVALGGRRVRAWVIAVGVSPPPGVELRPIAKVTGIGPPPELIDLGDWAARRWAGRLVHLLVSATPETAVRALPAPPARPAVPPGPRHPGAEALLDAGGGVLRLPPTADALPVVLAAAAPGNTLVVVPSQADAAVMALRLRRAGLPVARHPGDWATGAAGATVVGSRAAAWAPVEALGAVVVLDEHDEALQQESAPTWHARDVAVERARRAGVPCLVVSPSPSLDALAWAEQAGLPVVVPSRTDERAGWPVLDVVDRTKDDPWAGGLIGPALRRVLADPERHVVFVVNSPGRARRLACRSCHSTARCEVCDAAVGQGAEGDLSCSRCGAIRPVVCQACGSGALVPVRPGVTRLRRELEEAASRPVVEVTAATPSDRPLPEAGVHVGTEAVLHRVARADVVAFLDFDAELLAARFRAAEQAMALLARAARLVGPRAAGGRLLVQTRHPRHPVLDAALHADPGRLVEAERPVREALGFPPFRALAVVEGPAAAAYADGLRRLADLDVLGPAGGRFLVRARDADVLADGLAAVPRPAGRLRVEVDPRRL